MDFKEYSEKALRTAPVYNTIYDQIDNAIYGIAGELGEVADPFKKFKYQGHFLDENKLAEELGDILWYINLAANALGHTYEDIHKMNVSKLEKRYPTNKFRTEDSVNRVV